MCSEKRIRILGVLCITSFLFSQVLRHLPGFEGLAFVEFLSGLATGTMFIFAIARIRMYRAKSQN